MFFYHLILILLLALASLFQQFFPPIAAIFDARPLLLPLVFLCSAVTVPTPGMLLFAFLSGFIWDTQQLLLFDYGDPLIYKERADTLPFGYSIVLYAFMGFLMQGIRPFFQRGRWILSALLTGIAIFFYLWIEYLLMSFVRGGFHFGNEILNQIIGTALLSMALSPLVFAILFKLAHSFKYTIVFDTLKRRRLSRS